jgi:hypothetical protein
MQSLSIRLTLTDEAPASCVCGGHIISTMTLKSAAFFALIGMALLTVLLAVGFVRDVYQLVWPVRLLL